MPAGRSFPRFRLAIAVVLVAGVACAPERSSGPADATLVVPLQTDPESLNFLLATDGSARQIGRLVADSLVDHDSNLDFVPRLAESWTTSADGRVLTFRLRTGVRWHDGAPFTADDVRFTYQKIVDPASGARSKRGRFLAVERIETPDPYTVRVFYDRPSPTALLAWEVPILPKHRFTDGDWLDSPLNRAPIGTGPFRFVEWKTAREIVLAANDDYWRGPPPFRRVVFRILPSKATQYQALLAGEIDLAALSPEHWLDLEAAGTDRFRLIRYPRPYLCYIAWNTGGDFLPLRDRRVRRALAHLIDRDTYLDKVLRGFGTVTDSPFHPASFAHDPGLEPIRFDPVEADRLLAAAGWPRSPDGGLRRRDGEELRIEVLVAGGVDWQERFAGFLQESLQTGGVGVDLRRVEWTVLVAHLRRQEFQAAVSGFNLDIDPDPFPFLHSSEIGSGFNYAGYRDRQVDRLLDEGRATVDASIRAGIYHRLGRRLRDEQPYTFLWFRSVPLAVDARFENVTVSPLGLLQWFPGILDWRIANEPTAAPAPP